MPIDKLIAAWLPTALSVIMIGAGVVNFIGPRSVRDSFARCGYPAGFHKVTDGVGGTFVTYTPSAASMLTTSHT